MVAERLPVNGVSPPRTFRRNCGDQVSVSSPTKVFIQTNAKCPYYSRNDEEARAMCRQTDRFRYIDVTPQVGWLNVRTVLCAGEYEIQDVVAFVECDSSESGHLYESLEPVPPPPALSSLPMRPCPPIPASVPTAVPALIDDDFDSFDSDSDYDDNDKTLSPQPPALPASRLPTPPNASGQYTLTKIANAAQKKMRQIKRNLTKRYSVAMDGKTFIKSSNQNGTYDVPKNQTKTKSPTYANYEKPENQNVYSNINFETKPNKTENSLAKITGSFKEELKTVIGEKKEKSGEKRLSTGEKRLSGEIPPPLPEKSHPEKPTTPNEMKKDGGTLSRKAYLSFKSRFRRATSMAVDINSEIPSALKITNSTFYLTDSMDGDSGFSNCSDSGATPSDAASPRREELKRLLPTLSRKDKAPRTRTSWYAECVTDAGATYAEAGTYPAGNISSSSGASSASHPASPLPHSLFTHEPLYQFYNAAKVEVYNLFT
ncbi:unnamed protein product [Leptidea sinapis]|uniref:Uncharacterized protein n=1 Tax=Leptidea sinapis TaxID=189913 RepID=A0A5E4R3H6_9NEOP|nr:unnamed protein product [Leptidea sinapis]